MAAHLSVFPEPAVTHVPSTLARGTETETETETETCTGTGTDTETGTVNESVRP